MTAKLSSLLLASALALAGCGSGSSNVSGGSPTTSLTVSPSLGLVQNADVRVLSLGGDLLGEGRIDSSGTLTVSASGLNRGFVVEVQGNNDAMFYDEGLQAWRALPAGTSLHAVSADGRSEVAVTALTEIAYRRAKQLASGGALTAATVNQANAELSDWLAHVPVSIGSDGSQALAGGAPDILQPAQVVDGTGTVSSDTPEGRYAILLATLAQKAFEGAAESSDPCVADVRCSPVLPVIAQLATDYADGVLDDKNPTGSSNGLPFIDPDVDPVTVLPPAPITDPTPQQEIGREFPGSYVLTCDGDAEPSSLVIEASGAMSLDGPHGSYVLPVDDINVTEPMVEHAYSITPTGKAFTARYEHLQIGTPYNSVVVELEIDAHADGSVQLVKGGTTTNCTTSFHHGEPKPRIPYFTDVLYGTDFICTHTGGGPVTLGTLSFGPASFKQDGVIQGTQYGGITGYKHAMYKQPSGSHVATYEYYEWGNFGDANFLGIMRAMLRYEGYPNLDNFDMQHADNLQGMTNCSPDGPSWYTEVSQGSGIVLDFGQTQLSL